MYNDIYSYSYSVPVQDPLSGFGMGILMIYIIAILLVGIISLASYILRGVGLYTIAKRRGYQHAWLAFVPFMRNYLQGQLSGNIQFKNKTMRDTGIWLAVLPFMYGFVFSIIYTVMCVCGIITVLSMAIHVGIGRILFLAFLVLLAIAISVGYKVLYKTLRVLVNYQIYQNMTSQNMAVAHAVLGAFVPLYESICLFVMRNREENVAGEVQEDVSEASVEETSMEDVTESVAESQPEADIESVAESQELETPDANETISLSDMEDSGKESSDNE